jgi:hypothetical protein
LLVYTLEYKKEALKDYVIYADVNAGALLSYFEILNLRKFSTIQAREQKHFPVKNGNQLRARTHERFMK